MTHILLIIFFVIDALALIWFFGNKSKAPLSKSAPIGTNRYGIHIGINHLDEKAYNGFRGELRGPENDVTDITSELVGYNSEFILTENATAANIKAAIDAIAAVANEDTTVLFQYSGHGSRHKIGDKHKEFLCLYDCQVSENMVRSWLNAIAKKGAKVVCLIDSCHSGGMNRNIGIQMQGDFIARSMSPDVALTSCSNLVHEDIDDDDDDTTERTIAKKQKGLLWLMACKSTESAWDGTNNGLFTQSILNTWKTGNQLTLESLIKASCAMIVPNQTPDLKKTGNPSVKETELVEKIFF